MVYPWQRVVRVSWTYCQCIQPTDLGVAGGNVDLEWMELSHTLYCKHLTNLRLGLRRSPGINELVFVVKHWEVVGQCWINPEAK